MARTPLDITNEEREERQRKAARNAVIRKRMRDKDTRKNLGFGMLNEAHEGYQRLAELLNGTSITEKKISKNKTIDYMGLLLADLSEEGVRSILELIKPYAEAEFTDEE